MHISRFQRGRPLTNGQPLDDEQIGRIAPSIFAEHAHESRSARFAYIPTKDVLAGLRREGFEVTAVVQGGSRIEGKEAFTKHMMRLRHRSRTGNDDMGGVVPEVVLLNAHDGTSSYRAMAGIFRMVCGNGLIKMDPGGQEIRIPHTGDVMGRVIEGSYQVIEDAALAINQAREWQGVTLNHDERVAFAEAAHVLRFPPATGETADPANHAIKPAQLLTPRRNDDRAADLWTAHNVVQENSIRGGMSGWGRDANNRPRRVTARAVQSVDGVTNLNRALWQLSARMAEIKAAA